MGKLRITGDGTRAGTKIYVDDVRLEGVTHVMFRMGLDNKPEAQIVVRHPEIEIEGDFDVETVNAEPVEPEVRPQDITHGNGDG